MREEKENKILLRSQFTLFKGDGEWRTHYNYFHEDDKQSLMCMTMRGRRGFGATRYRTDQSVGKS